MTTDHVSDQLEDAGRRWGASQAPMPALALPPKGRSRGAREAVLIAAAVALIAIVSFAFVNVSEQSVVSTAGAPSSSAAALQDPEEETIVAQAMKIAAANGDKAPTSIQWVHVDSLAGFRAIGFSSLPVGDEAKQAGVAVVIRGSFTSNHPSPPLPGADPEPPLTGTTLTYFFNTSTQTVTAFKFSSNTFDLSAFGQVFAK